MTPHELLENTPSLDSLDAAISIQALQFALLQQQYAPTHPVFSKIPLIAAPAVELAEPNVGTSDFGSDKVTVGDATSVTVLLSCSVSDAPDSGSIVCPHFADANVAFFICL